MEFAGFLKASGFPAPIFCAMLSVYAQFICGILILVGYKTRFAAFILIFNFLQAIIMVHQNYSIEAMTPALAILFVSLGLLFTGAEKWVIEKCDNIIIEDKTPN